MIRSSLLMAIAALLMAGGCAKRVPSSDLTFEAHRKVVLTFRGGEEIEGRISPGKQVELREADATWKATVAEVTDEQIGLSNLVRVRDSRGVRLQVLRAEDARYRTEDPVPDKTFPRSDLVRVEQLKVDVGKTARTATFWTYGVVVLTLLLGERS